MDELAAVGDADLRAALLFARGRDRAVTADELAAAEGVHRNVARARLERLVEAGLLEVGYERRTGRTGPGAGRPAKTYAVAPSLESIEFPRRRYEALLGLMIDALPSRGRARKLHEIGAAFGSEIAGASGLRPARSRAGAFDAVCAAVGRLGYQAAVKEVGDDGAVLATPTCPLRPLVRSRPEAAELDRGMWAALVARAHGGDVAQVECETRDCLLDHASCRVRIRLRHPHL
jgi:predicted ArsR family transcriptional regulator